MHLDKHSFLQLMSDISCDKKCQQRALLGGPKSNLLMVEKLHAGRLIHHLRRDSSHIEPGPFSLSLLILKKKKKKKLQRQHLMMSFGPGPWETQLLGRTANPVRKWGEGGGRGTRTSPWRCRGEWEGRQRRGLYNYWLNAMMTCQCEIPSLPHSSPASLTHPLTLIAVPCEDKSWVPFLSGWCMWDQTWYKVKSRRNRLLQDALITAPLEMTV